MRFGHELGTRHTRTKFLWFPRCINGRTRWLETATWTEYWTNHLVLFGSGYWEADEWIEDA